MYVILTQRREGEQYILTTWGRKTYLSPLEEVSLVPAASPVPVLFRPKQFKTIQSAIDGAMFAVKYEHSVEIARLWRGKLTIVHTLKSGGQIAVS